MKRKEKTEKDKNAQKVAQGLSLLKCLNVDISAFLCHNNVWQNNANNAHASSPLL